MSFQSDITLESLRQEATSGTSGPAQASFQAHHACFRGPSFVVIRSAPVRIAVIGSGIAGFGAAHLLSRLHDVEVFERDGRPGGHAHTHQVECEGRTWSLDSGFLVFNPATYPNFVRLLDELGVTSHPTDMSFSARCLRCNLEYSTRTLKTLFVQPWRAVDPRHLRMLADMLRFFSQGRRLLASARGADVTLGTFLDEGRFGGSLARHFILPLTGAIWSASFDEMRAFPARPILQFMQNHGMLSATGHPRWRTVTGGSRSYVAAIADRLGARLHLGCGVVRVMRRDDGVDVSLTSGETRAFDKVVIATHADQALGLLGDPTPAERQWLAAFRYSHNHTVLHTGTSMLPRRRAAWAAWNAELTDCRDSSRPVSLTYQLNRLQGIGSSTPFSVTLNHPRPFDGDVLARMDYTHPILDGPAMAAQPQVAAINGARHTFYCGAHLRYGFHEDGLVSAVAVARALGVDW